MGGKALLDHMTRSVPFALSLPFKTWALAVIYAATIPFAAAQNAPSSDPISDITQVIRGILGESSFPNVPSGGQSGTPEDITRISVTANIDKNTAASGEWLVLSAYASPIAEERRNRGELLGETRVLLRGLSAPFYSSVSVPSAATQSGQPLLINGRIEDHNGVIIWNSAEDSRYDPFVLTSVTMSPNTAPQSAGDLPQSTAFRAETARGHIVISRNEEIFRGAYLTVQLAEAGLAGGQAPALIGATQKEITQNQPPIPFSFDFRVPETGNKAPLSLTAFITDWAGRKTHVMANAVDYNGPNYDYRLTLDPMRQGLDVENFEFSSQAAIQTQIRVDAMFTANRGLPPGAFLEAKLRSPLGTARPPDNVGFAVVPITQNTGRLSFSVSTPSVNIDPELPNLLMDVTLYNHERLPLFEQTDITVDAAQSNIITLQALPNY